MYYYRVEANKTISVLNEKGEIVKRFSNLEDARAYCMQLNVKFTHKCKL